ncbi:hypothetical protein AE621_28100 [Acidovorax sp. SD340]|nr:hypothetical protein AE621_28100 [Acidovorax sp. SD340]
MPIESVTVIGFRCFGPAPAAIPLNTDHAAMVGANASGKIAALQTLIRLFYAVLAFADVKPLSVA